MNKYYIGIFLKTHILKKYIDTKINSFSIIYYYIIVFQLFYNNTGLFVE